MWPRWLTDPLTGKTSVGRAVWLYGLGGSFVYFSHRVVIPGNDRRLYGIRVARACHWNPAVCDSLAVCAKFPIGVRQEISSHRRDCRIDFDARNALLVIHQLRHAAAS